MSEPDFPTWHADPRLPTDTPFTSADAARRGVGGNVLARLTREGALRRVVRGVYVDGATPDTPNLRARAISLVVPKAAVITDLTAAWLYGVDLYPPSIYWISRPLHYVRFRDCTRVRRPEVQSGRRTFADDDLRRLNQLTVTTPLRTAADLARSQRRGDALAALDAMLRLDDFSKDQLLGAVERFRGHRGVVQFRDLAPMADGRSESVNESKLRLEWIDAGLPAPDLQLPICAGPARRLYRLDIGDPAVKYAAEFDGEEYHSTPEQQQHDRVRRDDVRSEGWIIDVFHTHDLYDHATVGVLRAGHRRATERTERREQTARGVTDLSTHRKFWGLSDPSAI